MTQIQAVFERHEKKYVISSSSYERLVQLTREHLCLGEYGNGPVFSLYYDTAQHTVITKSMEKPLYKEKLRLRSYGPVQQDSPVFIELKKKFKGVVYKRRVCCSYSAALAYMGGASFDDAVAAFPLNAASLPLQSCGFKAHQTVCELDMFKRRNPGLEPSMFIAVDRTSFAAIDQPDLRITFDTNPVWRDSNLVLDGDTTGNRLMSPDEVIMEIKCSSAYPLWLVDALNAIQAHPQSCSKYGHAYTQQIALFDAASDIGAAHASTAAGNNTIVAGSHSANQQRSRRVQTPAAATSPAFVPDSQEVSCA